MEINNPSAPPPTEVFRYKKESFDVVSDIVLADDPELSNASIGIGWWSWECVLHLNQGGGGIELKMDIVPNAFNGDGMMAFWQADAGLAKRQFGKWYASTHNFTAAQMSSDPFVFRSYGFLECLSVSNFVVQFAQDTSSASLSRITKGSWYRFRLMGES